MHLDSRFLGFCKFPTSHHNTFYLFNTANPSSHVQHLKQSIGVTCVKVTNNSFINYWRIQSDLIKILGSNKTIGITFPKYSPVHLNDKQIDDLKNVDKFIKELLHKNPLVLE